MTFPDDELLSFQMLKARELDNIVRRFLMDHRSFTPWRYFTTHEQYGISWNRLHIGHYLPEFTSN